MIIEYNYTKLAKGSVSLFILAILLLTACQSGSNNGFEVKC
jgi:hypothetical protein